MEGIGQFIQLFYEVLEPKDGESITSESEYKKLDCWSSFNQVAIMSKIVERYGVRVTPQQMRISKTVGQLYHLVLSQCKS